LENTIHLECYTIFMRDLYNDVGSETITFYLTYIVHCYNSGVAHRLLQA